MKLLILFLLPLILTPTTSAAENSTCPLDFTVLNKFISAAKTTNSTCDLALQLLHLTLASYLNSTNNFFPPISASSLCWSSLQSSLSPLLPPSSSFQLPSSCGFSTPWISQGCMNITTKSDFEKIIPPAGIQELDQSCNSDLSVIPTCTDCGVKISTVTTKYLSGDDVGNVTTCIDTAFIYTAAVVNRYGPVNNGTAYCLFLLNSDHSNSSTTSRRSRSWIYGATVGCVVFVAVLVVGRFLILRRRKLRKRRKAAEVRAAADTKTSMALESISASTHLIKFSFEEIKLATRNFSRDNIIGRGGYGNVYKGTLRDGTEVALKRFKNTSAAGDESFAHEVEVIASIRHVNLVAIRGYCIANTQMEGHQRIIVCDLMRNGSLHDHLFGSIEGSRLSWPMRQKIALGMARGLAYLHDGVQPSIIHRDIKASNILLDDIFEAKVADFGLARFAPEGMTHVSTRVAGTLGYVAPEYALYGQLTEKSDVYSFGVVLLELLSGKKALVPMGDGQAFLVTDWAWSLVRKGRTLGVIEEGIDELGPSEVLEKYVHVAVLCTHPQLHARPMMDQIVKILETNLAVPTIPDRPISIISNLEEIERSMSSNGSGQLYSSGGYQSFVSANDHQDASSHGSEAL